MFPFAIPPDPRALGLEIAIEDGLGYTRPVSDPKGTRWLLNQDPEHEVDIRWGQVVDFLPYLNAYRVCFGPRSYTWCSLLSDTGFQPFGVRSSSTVPIGSLVYCIISKYVPWWGTIIGAEPAPIIGINRFFAAGQVWPGSHVGLKVDACHQATIRQTSSGGVMDFSAGRPLDQLSVEWSQFAETGLGILLDPFMAFMRVNEATGLFMFLHNQLARLSGHNLQIRSSGSDQESLNNRGELFHRLGIAAYYWEHLGAFSYPVSPGTISRSFTTEEIQTTQLEYGAIEPKFDDQQPFDRLQRYDGGYLGQGWQYILNLPSTAPISAVNRYGDLNVFPGVFKEQLSLAGSWALESAKRIVLRKTKCITTPKLIKRPEADNADPPSSYRSAGLTQWGPAEPPHIITDEVHDPDPTAPPSLVRSTAILDTLAFVFNWEGAHPYAYHSALFYLPEENNPSSPFSVANPPPNFNLLSTDQYIDPPAPIQVPVDHRYGDASYYPSESSVVLLEDGAVVIRGGEGCEIKMSSGNIFLSAPGDVFFQSGRNCNIWAGRDAIVKAHHSIDLTATTTDVRIKAQHNFMALAGNDTHGGILLESRTKEGCIVYDYSNAGEDVTTTGIIFKAAHSQVVTLAKDVFLRSGYKETDPGDIILDSGLNRVMVYTKYLERFMYEGAYDYFLFPAAPPLPLFGVYPSGASGAGCNQGGNQYIEVANEWKADTARIGTRLYVRHETQLGACLFVGGDISVVDGHIFTHFADGFDNKVLQLPDANILAIDVQLQQFSNRSCEVSNTIGVASFEWLVDVTEEVMIAKPEFTLRTAAQYGTNQDFLIFETYWQQLARVSGQSMPVWVENYVTSELDPDHAETYPYPGRDTWAAYRPGDPTNYFAWYLQDLTLYDVNDGCSIPRGTNQPDYEDPIYGPLTKVCLDGRYTITKGN